MDKERYIAFYTNTPFIVESSIQNREIKVTNRNKLLKQIAFEFSNNHYSLKIQRDGKILLHIKNLGNKIQVNDKNKEIQPHLLKWATVLNYLNSFYLLLDSNSLAIKRVHIFNYSEITRNDVSIINYKNGQYSSESLPTQSYSADRFHNRLTGTPLFSDVITPEVIENEILDKTCSDLNKLFDHNNLESIIANTGKSLAHYKNGDLETSIAISWFIIEELLHILFKSHLDALNNDCSPKRINRDRYDQLLRMDIGNTIEILELFEILNLKEYKNINNFKSFRNKIVHRNKNFIPTVDDALLGLKIAENLIYKVYNFELNLNKLYSYPVF